MRRQDAFGVGGGAKVPVTAQSLAQFEIIVDLAVVGDHGAVRRSHRLACLLGQIDDGKPAMAKANIISGRQPKTRTVRTAMRQ